MYTTFHLCVICIQVESGGGDHLLRKSPIFGGELVHDKEKEKVVYKEVDGAVYRGCCIGIQ